MSITVSLHIQHLRYILYTQPNQINDLRKREKYTKWDFVALKKI